MIPTFLVLCVSNRMLKRAAVVATLRMSRDRCAYHNNGILSEAVEGGPARSSGIRW